MIVGHFLALNLCVYFLAPSLSLFLKKCDHFLWCYTSTSNTSNSQGLHLLFNQLKFTISNHSILSLMNNISYHEYNPVKLFTLCYMQHKNFNYKMYCWLPINNKYG